MKETFREYLMQRCMEDTHALDDDLPDTYESWLMEQDVEDIIDWAEKWGKEQVQRDWQKCIECGEPVNPKTEQVLNCHGNCRLEL